MEITRWGLIRCGRDFYRWQNMDFKKTSLWQLINNLLPLLELILQRNFTGQIILRFFVFIQFPAKHGLGVYYFCIIHGTTKSLCENAEVVQIWFGCIQYNIPCLMCGVNLCLQFRFCLQNCLQSFFYLVTNQAIYSNISFQSRQIP